MDEPKALIARIRKASIADNLASGAVALLNVIPYAGGTIASIVGERATRRRFEKICDVLADLHDRLDEQGVDAAARLSEDQVIEVVHETLGSVSITSDQKKIAALKRGLGYAFTAVDPFERKQLYLKVLRELTSLELLLLSTVYGCSDPYHVRFRDPKYDLPDPHSYSLVGDALRFTTVGAQGNWQAIRNTESESQPVLAEYLAKEARVSQEDAEAALRRLDAQGLTAAGPNLGSRRAVWHEWVSRGPGVLAYSAGLTVASVSGEKVLPSALEATRTAFGRQFLDHFID